MDMSEIQPLGENSVLVGSAKPPEQTPVSLPTPEKPVEVASISTPQHVATEVVQATTREQMRDLFHEFTDLAKGYYTKIGKAMGGVAVHEGVKTLQGARELKLKTESDKENEVVAVEQITTKGRAILEVRQADRVKGTVTQSTYNVEHNDDGSKTTTKTTRRGVPIDAQAVENGEQPKKKGFWANAEASYKEGNKYALGQEAKNKQAEGAINAVGAIVTDTILQPYPDIPRLVTGITDAVSSYIPNKGIEFIPAVLQILKADLDVVKGGVDLAKRLREIIRNSPEAQGAKGIDASIRVAKSLITEQIHKMSQPKVQQAAAVFA